MKHLILVAAFFASVSPFTAKAQVSTSDDGTFIDCGSFKLQHIYNSALRIGSDTFTIPEIAAELNSGGYRGALIQMTSDSVNYLVTDLEINGASVKVTVSSFGGIGTKATLVLTKNDQVVHSSKCSIIK